jgi:hypothetical protein
MKRRKFINLIYFAVGFNAIRFLQINCLSFQNTKLQNAFHNIFKSRSSNASEIRKTANAKDFPNLQDAINYAVTFGKTLKLEPKKIYLIDKTLIISLKGGRFSIDGQSATLLVEDASMLDSTVTFNDIYASILINVKSEIKNFDLAPELVIENLNLISKQSKLILGFALDGNYKSLKVRYLTAKNLKHSALWNRTNTYEAVGTNPNGTALVIVKNASVSDCYLEQCGTSQNAAIHINCPGKLIVKKCSFLNSTGYSLRVNGGALDTIPNSIKGARNIHIKNCLFDGWAQDCIGLQVTKAYNVKVQNNRFNNEPGNKTDNSIDIFNCWSTLISHNYVFGSKGVFVGHADLGLTTTKNLVGTRDAKIYDNVIRNTVSEIKDSKSNSLSKINWGSITIGGDGTVDGLKQGRNFVIKNNSIIDNVGISENSAIHSFICQYVSIENNYVQGTSAFYSEYYSKNINVRANVIRDVPNLLIVLGGDWMTQPAHHYCDNSLLGSSRSDQNAKQFNGNCKQEKNLKGL